jgi:predicted ATPase
MGRSTGHDRVWDRVSTQPGLVRKVDVVSSPVLAPGSVELSQFTVLAGFHGAGKSYLMAALGESLPSWLGGSGLPIDDDSHEAQLSGRYRLHLRPGSPQATVEVRRPLHYKVKRIEQDALQPLRVTRLSPYIALMELACDASLRVPGRPDCVAELEPVVSRGLDALRRITGYDYASMEYSYFADGQRTLPYFRGERDSRLVHAATMSSSEFWVNFVLFSLREADEDEIVLIDEPETFLAQPHHAAFIDEIARLTLDRGCQTVVATHSEAMLSRVPARSLRLVSATSNGAVVSPVESSAALLRALGRDDSAVTALAFVEDEMAARILRAILREEAPDALRRLEIIDSGGKDEVRAGVRVAAHAKRIRVAGVLDGDERGSEMGDGLHLLPGSAAPEVHLMRALRDHEDEAASSLRVAITDLRLALDVARPAQHQRVFDVMSSCLTGPSADDVVECAVALWLAEPDVSAQAKALAEQMKRLAYGL